MPRKSKSMRGGKNLLHKISKVASHVGDIAKAVREVNHLAKETKLGSRVLGLVPNVYAQSASSALDKAGYGKRRKRGKAKRGRRKGGSMMVSENTLGIGYQPSRPIFQ